MRGNCRMNKDEMIEKLLLELEKLEQKRRLGAALPEDWFEPGQMENLEQYAGIFDESEGQIFLKTEVKGLRYEDRTPRRDRLSVGDSVRILRDPENPYNPNNFTVENDFGENLGNLPAELCNALAPLVDAGYAEISEAGISYLERIRDRSRYAKQGILFVHIELRLI